MPCDSCGSDYYPGKTIDIRHDKVRFICYPCLRGDNEPCTCHNCTQMKGSCLNDPDA